MINFALLSNKFEELYYCFSIGCKLLNDSEQILTMTDHTIKQLSNQLQLLQQRQRGSLFLNNI